MKKLFSLMAVFILLASVGLVIAKGFDEFGYNRDARVFVGTCVSWYNGKFGGSVEDAENYCGPYAYDHLKMKWNAEWDRGNADGWDEGPYDAWLDNQWSGMVPGGSKETWHYMIKWDQGCADEGTPSIDGENVYCIWGDFVMLMSHGTYIDEHPTHLWDAHATPTGYGN